MTEQKSSMFEYPNLSPWSTQDISNTPKNLESSHPNSSLSPANFQSVDTYSPISNLMAKVNQMSDDKKIKSYKGSKDAKELNLRKTVTKDNSNSELSLSSIEQTE